MLDTSGWKVGTIVGYVELKPPRPEADRPIVAPDFWLIGVATPPHETETCERVRDLGIPFYLPIVQKQRRAGRGRVVDIVEPLIRSYFFVPASITQDEYTEIRHTRGVSDFLQMDGKPAVIRERELERIRKEEQRREALRQRRILTSGQGPRYIVGEAVTINVGFLQLDAKVDAIPSPGRVKVKLEGMTLFGRNVVEVDLAHIRPAN